MGYKFCQQSRELVQCNGMSTSTVQSAPRRAPPPPPPPKPMHSNYCWYGDSMVRMWTWIQRYFGGGSIKFLTMLELHSSMFSVHLRNRYYACPMLMLMWSDLLTLPKLRHTAPMTMCINVPLWSWVSCGLVHVPLWSWISCGLVSWVSCGPMHVPLWSWVSCGLVHVPLWSWVSCGVNREWPAAAGGC